MNDVTEKIRKYSRQQPVTDKKFKFSNDLLARAVQSDKIKQHKKRRNYTINKHTIDRFKQLCQKRGWIMSVVVENKIKRLIDNI